MSSGNFLGLGLPLFLLFLLPFLFLFLFFFLRPKPTMPKTRSSRQKLPPGTVGLPFIGETLKLIAAYKTENPEPFIAERVRRYGRLFTTHVFGERTVFSADPDFNRLVLRGEGRSVVECSYPASICTLLGQHSLLLMPLGSLHKRLHSLTLTLTRHSLLLPHIDHLVTRTMASWGDYGDCSRRRILLLDQAKQLTFDLTVKQLLSIDPGPWTEALRREYVLLIDAFFSVPLPSFLAFSFTAYGRAIKARKKVAEALRQVIREKMEERSIRIREEGHMQMNKDERDMVDTLLDLDGESSVLSEEEMVDFLLALLIAGYETTSTSITLAVKFLTDNPSALALLRDEHDKIRATKGNDSNALDWTDYKSMMPFTQCVISETLRVANIVSGVFRRAVTDIDYKGYTIPKGCKIFASFRAVHMDEEYFKSAAVFDPWRWQSTDTFHQQVISAGVFTPFGGGARLCPGYELARVVISVFLHHLVTRFSWEAAEEDRLVFFPTTRTSKGYPIFVRARAHAPTPAN